MKGASSSSPSSTKSTLVPDFMVVPYSSHATNTMSTTPTTTTTTMPRKNRSNNNSASSDDGGSTIGVVLAKISKIAKSTKIDTFMEAVQAALISQYGVSNEQLKALPWNSLRRQLSLSSTTTPSKQSRGKAIRRSDDDNNNEEQEDEEDSDGNDEDIEDAHALSLMMTGDNSSSDDAKKEAAVRKVLSSINIPRAKLTGNEFITRCMFSDNFDTFQEKLQNAWECWKLTRGKNYIMGNFLAVRIGFLMFERREELKKQGPYTSAFEKEMKSILGRSRRCFYFTMVYEIALEHPWVIFMHSSLIQFVYAQGKQRICKVAKEIEDSWSADMRASRTKEALARIYDLNNPPFTLATTNTATTSMSSTPTMTADANQVSSAVAVKVEEGQDDQQVHLQLLQPQKLRSPNNNNPCSSSSSITNTNTAFSMPPKQRHKMAIATLDCDADI